MAHNFFRRYKYTLLYGSGLALLLILLKWLEWRFLIFDHAIEVYSGAIAILFTGLGIWLALKLARPKIITVRVPVPAANETPTAEPATGSAEPAAGKPTSPNWTQPPAPDPRLIAQLGLSGRELEVLQGMAEGLSNQEIGERLFLSLNTIKTHSARIYEKLDVRRRTQAVEKARRLRILAENAYPKAESVHPKA